MWQVLLTEEAQQYIQHHKDQDTTQLALQDGKKELPFPLAKALVQIDLRKKALIKLPSWLIPPSIIFPSKLALEQCSSEQAAAYKSNLIKGELLVDLTGGMGVDSSFFANRFKEIIYIEPNEELCEITNHNLKQLGKTNVACKVSTAEEFLLRNEGSVDFFYIDPSRRDHERKTFLLNETVPNIVSLHPKLISCSNGYLLKASPLLDIKHIIDTLKSVSSIHVVAIDGEVKEVLALCGKEECPLPTISTINLKGKFEEETFVFNMQEEANTDVQYAMPQSYLYEPNASIMKAGAFKSVAARFGLAKLHPSSHLYTSEELIESFPGRTFQIVAYTKPAKKEIMKFVTESRANVATRNYPLSADALRQNLGLQDGGEHYIFGTTLMNQQKAVIITKKVSPLSGQQH